MSPELKPIVEAIKSGNKEKARDYLRPLMKKNPTADVMYLASLVALNPKQAKQFLEQAITLDPFHELANRAIEQLNPNGDENSPIQKEISIQKEAEEYFRLGVFHQEKGNLDKAYYAYTEAIRIYPEYADAYYRRSEVNRQTLNLRPALDDYEAAVRFNPRLASLEPKKYAVLYFNWAEIQQQQVWLETQNSEASHHAAMLEYTRAIQLNPNLAAAYAYRGSLYHDIDKQRAFEDYSEAIRLNPQIAMAVKGLWIIKAKTSGNPLSYMEVEREILDSSSDPQVFDETGEFFYARGNHRYDNADDSYLSDEQTKRMQAAFRTQNDTFPAAISDFTRAIQINPLCARYYYLRGNARRMIDDLKGSISDYEMAIKLGKTDWALSLSLAYSYYSLAIEAASSGRLDASIYFFTSAIRAHPTTYAEAYSLRGRILAAKGSQENDKQSLQKAILDFNTCLEKLNRAESMRQKDVELVVRRINGIIQEMIETENYSQIPAVHQESEELLKIFREVESQS